MKPTRFLLISASAVGLIGASLALEVPLEKVVVNPVLSVFVLGPMIEETIRWLISRRYLIKLNVLEATTFGALIGLIEVGLNLWRTHAHLGFDFITFLNVLGFASAVPLHIAFALAYYAFRPRWRLAKMITLHAFMNTISSLIAVEIFARLSLPVAAAVLLAVITAVCASIGYWATRRIEG